MAGTVRAFIDFPQPGGAPRERARFERPCAVLEAWTPAEVIPLLRDVQAHARAGRWCLGGLAYEAAGAFDAALTTHAPRPGWPLARFAVFTEALDAPLEAPAAQASSCGAWDLAMTREHYAHCFERVTAAMAAGECLQLNLTTALRTVYQGDPAAWMQRLARAQPDAYLLWLDAGEQQVLSASPELFFHWDAERGDLVCQPMKGTAPRDADPRRDAEARDALAASAKERAENVMIADLLRSDLGRIAMPGSVQVPHRFEVMGLPTVWQMTTTVTARARSGVDLAGVFQALFPCGSITGAPKAAAMRWLTQMEDGPRGFYCGALGVVRPGGSATFNVPIRTVVLERESGGWRADYGVGSGLTVYAGVEAEWQELAAKSRLAERTAEDFELLETLRLEDGCYWLLPEHLERLRAGAAHFGFPHDAARVQEALAAVAAAHPAGLWRVRLTLDAAGTAQAQALPLDAAPRPLTYAVSSEPYDPLGHVHEFVSHKTTRRAHYEAMHDAASGAFDTLLVNLRGELTEFTRGNLALRRGEQWLTPPLASGLLPGAYRGWLLAQGLLREQVLTLEDLARADEVVFYNSLRGWLPLAGPVTAAPSAPR